MVKVCRLQTVVADLQRASGTYAEDGTWDDRAFYRRTGPGADFVLFRTSVPFQLDVGCVAAGTWLLSDSVSWDAPAAIAEGDGIFPPIRGWQHAQSGASMLISVRPVRGSVAATVVAKQEPKSVEEPEVEEANADDCDEADVEQDSPLEEVEQLRDLVVDVMPRALELAPRSVEFAVAFKVATKLGTNWGELE